MYGKKPGRVPVPGAGAVGGWKGKEQLPFDSHLPSPALALAPGSFPDLRGSSSPRFQEGKSRACRKWECKYLTNEGVGAYSAACVCDLCHKKEKKGIGKSLATFSTEYPLV